MRDGQLYHSSLWLHAVPRFERIIVRLGQVVVRQNARAYLDKQGR